MKTRAPGFAAALALSSTVASAEPHRHDGFFIAAGPNVGIAATSKKLSFHSTASTSESTSLTTGFDLRVGGSPVPGIVIGTNAIVALTPSPRVAVKCDTGCPEQRSEYTGETRAMLGLGPSLQVYPSPDNGLNLGIDLGYGRADGLWGPFVAVGAGYGFWIGDEWSVGPFARVLYFSTSVEGEGVSMNYFYPSVGVIVAMH